LSGGVVREAGGTEKKLGNGKELWEGRYSTEKRKKGPDEKDGGRGREY